MKRMMMIGAVLLAACGDGGTEPVDSAIPVELTGEWYTGATCFPQCGLTIENVADASDTTNFALLSTTTLRLTAAGGYRMEISGASDTTITGTARAEGSMLVVADATGADTVDYVLEGDYLSLRWRRVFEVTDLGGTYDARLRGRFRRR